MRNLLAAAALAATVPALPAAAAPIRSYGALALSPNGEQIATLESAGMAGHAAVTLRDARTGRVLRSLDPCMQCDYSGLTYSADGSLAFLARDRTAGSVAVMLTKTGAARTVATVAGLAQTPRFSPDGRRIALLVTLGANKENGATQAGARQVGEIGEKPDEQRLAVVDVTTGAPKAVTPLSPAGRYVYEYDWTPDGRGFVATTALGNGDDNWWVATLDAIDAGTGAVRPIAKLPTQANYPRVSPDGRTVAYIGGLMSDFGSVGGDIWSVPLAGGTPVNRTPGVKLTFTSLAWTKGGLRAATLAGDQARVVPVDLAKGVGPAIFAAPVTLGAGDGRAAFSADGRVMAASVQDWEHAPAIYAGPAGAVRAITHDNDAVAAITRARSVTWTSGGYQVQGWLLQPLAPPASGKAPMIVNVHGGPSAASVPRFMGAGGSEADLLAKGYYLFLPNPRGSYGQGEAFTTANKRDFGYGDLKDILAGVDAVEKVAPVDDARLGLMGGSYGGFMAMWANTQTNRFKAIIASAGISNWISYYGTNGIDQWMIPFMGKSAYDDPAAYRRMSAIDYIRQAKTPTLILVGERDIEVPPTQSLEYWHALRAMNVPTTLVIYPDEGHGIRDPKNAMDAKARGLAWFDKYLGR